MPPTKPTTPPNHYNSLMDKIHTTIELKNKPQAAAYFRQLQHSKFPTVNTSPTILEQTNFDSAQATACVKTELIKKSTDIYKTQDTAAGTGITLPRFLAGLPTTHQAFNLCEPDQMTLLAPPTDTTNMSAKDAKDAEKTWNASKDDATAIDVCRKLTIDECCPVIQKACKDAAPPDVAAAIQQCNTIEDILQIYSDTYNHKDVCAEANSYLDIMTSCKNMSAPTTSTIGDINLQLNTLCPNDKDYLIVLIAANMTNPALGTDRNKLAQEIIHDFETNNAPETWTLHKINQRLRTIETTERHSSPKTTVTTTMYTTTTPTRNYPPVPRKDYTFRDFTSNNFTTTTRIGARLGTPSKTDHTVNTKPDNSPPIAIGAQFKYKDPKTREETTRCTACCQKAHPSHSSTNCNYYSKWKQPHINEPTDIKNSDERARAIKRLEANNMTLDTNIEKGTNAKTTHNRNKVDPNHRPTKRSKSPPQLTLTTTAIHNDREMDSDDDSPGLIADSDNSDNDNQNIFAILHNENYDGYSSDISIPRLGDESDEDTTAL